MKRPGLQLSLCAALIGVASLAACGGGGGGGGSIPNPTPTPTSTSPANFTVTPAPASAAIYCDAANPQNPQARVWTPPEMREASRRTNSAMNSALVPGVVNVTYDMQQYLASGERLRTSETRAGAREATELDFRAINRVTRVLQVAPGSEQSAIAAIKKDPAVISVTRSAYRHLESSTPAFTNDPYELGFTGANTPPLYEGNGIPGQWDVHIVCAPNAWGYANTPNGTGAAHAGAAGGASGFPIAIIDTGADLTHPELQPSSRIVYAEQETGGNGKVTAVGTASMHDTDGHGTNVAGIAAATGNNALGFAGVAYNAPLMIFKVFPDCGTGSCVASSADIATAISDAVKKGAKVISLSLGADTPASDEEGAVANAIASNVIVVAAAGNGNANTGIANPALSYPAADLGVIAVGASGVDDTNPASPNLKVASYSNYVQGSKSWGVLAPGGDPCPATPSSQPCTDADNLHWIENIYSSKATSPGDCTPDFGSSGSTIDCRILIAGTSQATPHVSGAAALLLSVGVPQNPATMKNLLCNSTQLLMPTAYDAAHQGCGELDVYRAMAAALGDPTYP